MANETNDSVNDILTQALFKEGMDKLKSVIVKKFQIIENNIDSDLDNLRTKLDNKISLLKSIADEAPLTLNVGTVEVPKNKLIHQSFTTVMEVLNSAKRINKNIMLVGSAGSGKSSLCADIAEALKLDFYPMSVGLQTTKSDLLGFINAKGDYVTTPVRQAFENGGVLLLDEFDATHAGTVTILNSMLANDICSFPDKIVKKHPKFICFVACNTYGTGASLEYIGRNRLDSATLDRFVVVNVDYDKKLEKELTHHDLWLKTIEQMRENIAKQGLKVIVSPRASMQGADLLDAGFDINKVLEMCIFKGVGKDVQNKLLKGINLNEFNSNFKPEKVVQKNTEPACVQIDFINMVYKVENVLEPITILGSTDWEGNSNIFISSSKEWQTGIMPDGSLYLNSGEGQFDISCTAERCNNFLNKFMNYYGTIKTDTQNIRFVIITNIGDKIDVTVGD